MKDFFFALGLFVIALILLFSVVFIAFKWNEYSETIDVKEVHETCKHLPYDRIAICESLPPLVHMWRVYEN